MRGQICRTTLVALFVVSGLCATVVGATAGPRAKPSAPIDVTIAARPTGGATYEVTLVATPRRDVKGLVLDLDGRRTVIGATAAGQTRAVTARVSLGALRGREVAGGAAVETDSGRRRAAASVRVGAAAAAAVRPVQAVRLPDGELAAEVRQ
ncbi:MAG TPA: hypothetical protein VM261_30830 [Kofleriaceae bacterium]|nr:hypothetical protein [Kofleriaceae bacterium]